MALTEVPIELSSTPGIIDNSTGTAITIDASQNVGIGTSSPYQAKLDVKGIGSVAQYAATNSSSDQVLIGTVDRGVTPGFTFLPTGSSFVASIGNGISQTLGIGTYGSSPVIFGTANTERMRIDANGNAGIGTSNATPSNGEGMCLGSSSTITRLDIRNSTTGDATGDGTSLQLNNNDFTIENREAGYVAIATSLTERMRIDASGNVKVNDGYLEVNTESTAAAVVRVDYNATDSIRRIHALETGGGNARPLQIHAQDIRFRDDTTERMRIDSSGNVGLGVTPSAWASGTKAFDVGSGSALFNPGSTTLTWLMSNSYNNGTNFIYKNTGAAGYYSVGSAHSWYTAASGTAGNTISFTQAMTLDASGNLLVGKTATGLANAGVEFTASNLLRTTKADSASAEFNRTGTDGDIAIFWKDTLPVGSIGTGDGDIVVSSRNDKGFKIYAPNADGTSSILHPSTNATGSPLDAKMDLGYALGRFKDLYLSGGVVFGATGGAVTSKTLDDYEEGTWTAAINYGTPTGTSATLVEAGGSYTKVGRLVTVHAEIDVSNTNGGSGHVYILGLPFTVADLISVTGLEATGIIGYFNDFSNGVNNMTVAAENNTTYMGLYGLTSSTATAINTITAADMGTGELRLSLTYFTT